MKNKKILISLLFFLNLCYLYSFENNEKEKILQKGYDILRYNLYLKIDMQKGLLSGINKVSLVPVRSINNVILHSSGLNITEITIGNRKLQFKTDVKNEKLEIFLDKKINRGDTLHLNINYSYNKDVKRKPDRLGFYYYEKNKDHGIFNEVLENEAYTMSEPSDARCWFPCWDEPNDKVLSRMEITVDNGYTAVSNGLLEGTRMNEDSTITYIWDSKYPISTYLMSFAVSRYSTFSHYVERLNDPNDKMEIKYYVWQPDSNGQFYNAVHAFREVGEMIKVFSKVYGEYPFEKYGMVAVAPFEFGGEEHQTMTTIHRYWLNYDEHGIAHELSHQWWGDLITCGDWKDIWLNESFATYSEAIWVEKGMGESLLVDKINSFYRLGKEWECSIYNPTGQGLKLFSDIVYQKGALVLHTLRNIIGDSLFFKVLIDFKEKYKYSYAINKDFISIVNNVCGKNMQWFFDQYIFGKGWPKISYSWKYDDQLKKIHLTIKQVQPDSWPVYKFPLEISSGTSEKNLKIELDGKSRKQEFTLSCSEKPKNLILNPESKVFMEVVR
jgi:aminopeptidase N